MGKVNFLVQEYTFQSSKGKKEVPLFGIWIGWKDAANKLNGIHVFGVETSN